MAERMWTGLDEAQADGRACVICGRAGAVAVPVGRSDTGSQVFACEGRCEAAAAGRGEAVPPVGVVYDDMADLLADIVPRDEPTGPPLRVPVEALDALYDASSEVFRDDASSGVFRAELEAAVRETVAPLVVAAELRRLADVLDGWGAVPPGTVLPDPATTGDIAGRLRARAAELDGGER